MIAGLSRLISRFQRTQDGSATVEFAILFPAFLAVFISAYESGIMMVRNVMLERAVDLAVRDLRLGTPVPPSFDEFKDLICDNIVVLSDCTDVIQVELEPVDPNTWTGLTGQVRCIDQDSNINPLDQTRYAVGEDNEMMFVRVCALYQPFFPSSVFGMRMPSDGNGNYALVATSAFVNEPN